MPAAAMATVLLTVDSVLHSGSIGNGGVVYFPHSNASALRHGGPVAVISTLFSFHLDALRGPVATR